MSECYLLAIVYSVLFLDDSASGEDGTEA